MIEFTEDILLGHDVLLLVLFEDVLLLEDFHCVDLLVLLAADQQHLRVGAFADHRQPRVVVEVSPFHF